MQGSKHTNNIQQLRYEWRASERKKNMFALIRLETMTKITEVTAATATMSITMSSTTKQPFPTNMMQLNRGNKLGSFIVSLNV